MNPILKFIGLTVLMYGCVLFGISGYHMGFISDIFMWLIAVGLATAAFFLTRKLWELTFLYVNLLVSVFISGKCMTYLYYTNISSDDMSLIVGGIFTLIGTGFAFIVACAGITVKAILISRKKKKELKADNYFFEREKINIHKTDLNIKKNWFLFPFIYCCCIPGILLYKYVYIATGLVLLFSLAVMIIIFKITQKAYDLLFLCAQLVFSAIIGLKIIETINYMIHIDYENYSDIIEAIYSQLKYLGPNSLYALVVIAEIIIVCTVLFTIRAVKLKKEELLKSFNTKK